MGRFFWYPDGTRNPWQSWHDRQSKAVRARHDVVIRFLEAGHWNEPYAKQLVGYDGLVEIIITKGVAHRLLGFYGLDQGDFTVVIACAHKGDNYYPKDAKDTAKARKILVEEGKERAVYCPQPRPKRENKELLATVGKRKNKT